ncbi:MAG: hypothetical protein WAZ21_05185 [Candidatus Saccharimonadales bacterium]
MLQNKNHGFTIVEVLVIAPIVILALGAFIAVMVNMTAEVLKTQSENSMVQNTQDALNTIEQDVKLSGQFLAANELTAQTPQGYDNGTGPINDGSNANSFANVYPTGNTKGKMLILRTFMTDKNPIDGTRQPIYTNQPTFSCSPKTINKLFASNTVYFVKNKTLWKRTIVHQGSGRPDLCDTPWQQPSCDASVTKGAYCKVNDTRLADNVSDFTIDYFTNPGDTTPIADAVNPAMSVTQRNEALSAASTMRVTISTANTVAGRDVTSSAAVRATKLNVTSEPPVVVALGFTQQPTNQATIPADGSTKFSVAATISTATYQWQQSTNGGTSWTNISNGANYSGATTNELTVSNFTTSWNGYQYRVVITNFGDTSTSTPSTLTVSTWGDITYLNGYSDYLGSYSPIGYTKTSAGVVMLKGLVKKSSPVVAGEVIGVLPPEYRPNGILIFETSTSPTVPSRVDIYPNGEIRVQTGDESWLSLEGINFIPSSTSYTRTTLTPVNSWANYGGSFSTATAVTDSLGRVHVQGLIRNGVMTNGTQMVTGLPALPAKYHHVVARNNGTFGFIGIDQTAGIVAKGVGSNGYHSINTMYYPASYGGWINLGLQNSWVGYDGGAFFATPQYTKSSDNIVRLKGIIKNGNTAAGTVVANLPAGYRPKDRILSTSVCADAYCRVDILPNGNVELYASSATWTTLDSVIFLAEL